MAESENQIPDVKGLATKSVLTAVENKYLISNISAVKKQKSS